MTKRCKKCEAVKPATDFNKDNSKDDGLFVWCRECQREYKRSWNQKSREHVSEYNKRWRGENPQQLEKNRAWYAKNKHRLAAGNRQRALLWARDHPDRARARSQRYRSRKGAAIVGELPVRLLDALIEAYGDTCLYPGCSRTDLEIDHVIPLSRGGSHTWGNLQLLCKSHNCAKGNRTMADYRSVKNGEAELSA